ncbi:MAG: hypothetical protein DME23_08450 [Verrucomicrobia bacterium]|nr:MAG: hypothetical protein DME23_08450 [Verrucomicrobiota bacterium]
MNRWFAPGLLLIVGLALALRLPELDRRPMHNDEGVNAMRFRSLWVSHTYQYDPYEFHGPTLEYATVLSAWLTGSNDFDRFTEFTFRRVTVAFGVVLILLLFLLVDGLGKAETLWAAALTAISPAMVFYSRYYIHEMLLVFFTLLTLVASWRYVQTKSSGWSLLAGVGLGLMYATKETFVFALVSMVAAAACASAWGRWMDGQRVSLKSHLNLKHIFAALAAALLVSMAFFSSLFTNVSGPLDSLRTYLPWLHRAGGESPHVHSWYFYFRRLVFFHYQNGPFWSEALIVVLAVVGFVAALRRRPPGQTNVALARVLAFYTASLTLIYSVVSYKTPWCSLGFFHGMILLAGLGAMALLRVCRPQWLKWTTGAALVAAAAQLGWQAWRASFPYCASQFNPYVYAQTSPDILKLVEKVEALARVSPQGHDTVVKVMAPGNDYWPLPWYLRRFKKQHVGFWNEIPPEPFAPIMIVSAEFQAAFDERPEKTHLMAGYFQLRPQVFFELYVEINLWREYVNTLAPEKD